MLHKQQANWSPYDNNEGYCVAIADTNYCIFAIETQMLTDVKVLQKYLTTRHLIYQHHHNKQMNCLTMAPQYILMVNP
ncbi:hypothetical protein GQ457_10G017220 [Hibiscus cannabinus]